MRNKDLPSNEFCIVWKINFTSFLTILYVTECCKQLKIDASILARFYGGTVRSCVDKVEHYNRKQVDQARV